MKPPTAGSRVCCKVTLAAKASDNFGVASVEFKVDGNTVGVDSTAPYEVTWDSTGRRAGRTPSSVVATTPPATAAAGT